MEKISIFMPVYNGAEFLRRSIGSVLNQTYSNWELFCVDDCSTDDSYNIICSLSGKDGRIKPIRKEVNGGSVPKSWNYIINKLDGDFVQYLTQDDLLAPDYFEKQIKCYHETGADWIVARYSTYDYTTESAKIDAIKGGYDRLGNTINGNMAFILSIDWSISGFGLTKRSLYDGVLWDEKYYNSDDLVCKTMFHKCNKVAFGPGIYYRGNNPKAITSAPKPFRLHMMATEFEILRIIRDDYKMSEAVAQWQICHMVSMFRLMRAFIKKYAGTWTIDEASMAKSVFNDSVKRLFNNEAICLLFKSNVSFYRLYVKIKADQLGNPAYLKGFVYKLRTFLFLCCLRRKLF